MSTVPSEPHEPVGELVGDGAPRYGEDVEEIPKSGTEESWSSQPHPGFEARPADSAADRRLAAGAVIGALLLAGGIFAVYSVLTAKSPNGSGAAPWTAAVTEKGAVVQGINAQNNVGSNTPPLGENQQEVQSATAACSAATNDRNQLAATTGTAAGIQDWAAKATPSMDELKGDAAQLGTAVNTEDVAGIANAAQRMCGAFGTINQLPALSDAAGAAAWKGGVTAYADAANHALKGAIGDQSALLEARSDLARGDGEMKTLSARIMGAM
jgi:hypothetical protein